MAKRARPIFNPQVFGTGSPSSTFLMDSNDDGVAFIFQATRSSADNLNYLGAVLNVTAGSPSVRFAIESVTAGLPSGTSLLGGAGYVVVTPSGSTPTMYFADMSALPAFAFTPGTYYAFTIRGNNLAAGTTCTVTHAATSANATSMPLVATQTNGAAWVSTTGRPQACVLLENNDEYTELGFSPIDSFAVNSGSQSITSATTPDEVGITWLQQTEEKLAGVQIFGLFENTSAAVDLVLYEDGTQIASVSVNPAHLRIITAAILTTSFPAAVNLRQGKTYILSVKPTTTNYIRLGAITFPTNVPEALNSERLRDLYFGRGYRSVRTDGGSWTATAQACPFIIPLVEGMSGSDADQPASGGGFWGSGS